MNFRKLTILTLVFLMSGLVGLTVPENLLAWENPKRWRESREILKILQFQKELKKHKLPVKIAFTFIRGTKHKFDYINPAQTVQDDMVTHGWIEDDNMEFIIPVFKPYQYNKEKPGVIIEIIN